MKQLMEDIKNHRASEGFRSFFKRKHLPVVAYLLLAGLVAFGFWSSNKDREQRRVDLAHAFALQCERSNELSSNQAADIYEGWVNLEKNAKLLNIELTPELRQEVLSDSNAHLKKLKYYDCSVSPFEKQRFVTFQPILADKPVPKVPPKLPSRQV